LSALQARRLHQRRLHRRQAAPVLALAAPPALQQEEAIYAAP
jgi:hypothetical protein